MAKRQQTSDEPTATKYLKTDDKQFICNICIEHYRNPRYLPTCGHTFCEICLLTYIQNVQQEDQGSTFDCPVCRKANSLPKEGKVTLEWVQTFPRNTTIIKLMPQCNEDQKLCQPCRKIDETRTGLNLCLECKEILCGTCSKYHTIFKISEGHKLIDIQKIATKKNRVEFFTNVGKCAVHAERDVEIYCKTHDIVMCPICSSFQHNNCELSEIVGNDMAITKLSKDAEVLMSQMIEAIDHVSGIQKLKMEAKTNLKLRLEEIRGHVEQVRDRVVELVDNVMSHIRAVTKKIELEKGDGIDEDMSKVSKLKQLTEEKVALLDTIGQHGSERHKFVSWHHINKQFKETSKQIEEEDRNVKQLDVKLVMSDNLQKLSESVNVEDLVQIQVTESESDHIPLAPSTRPQTDIAAKTDVLNETDGGDLVQIQVTEGESDHIPSTPILSQTDIAAKTDVLNETKLVTIERHNVSADHGRVPWYHGIAMWKDGRVILSDFRSADNKYLCLYDPKKRRMRKLNVMSRVYSAVQIDDTHIAFSMPDNKTISIVTVGNSLTINKTFQTKYTPRDIVALNDGLLAVAWNNPPAFGVIDINGAELVQTKYLDQDTSGRKFKYFLCLAVDETRQHVIQSCTEDKAVYCFHFEGKPIFKYTHQELTHPRGVALDNCGNIYVCDYDSSSRIYKLSPTGDPISIITEGVPSLPLAICSDVTGSGLWITRDSPPRDKIVHVRLEQIATS